jgi:starch synthase
MKIGVVTKEWPPEVYGGAGVHVTELVKALSKKLSVEVHCFGAKRPVSEFAEVYSYQNLESESVLNPAVKAMAIDLQIASNLAEVDLIHSHTWYANFAGVVGKQLHNRPHILSAHSLEPDRPWKEAQLGGGYRLSSYMEKAGYQSADGIIAVSQGTKKDILRAYPFVDPAKVEVIYNGIDSKIYFPRISISILDKYQIASPFALFVGRITRQKGLIHLINAWKQVPAEYGLVIAAGSPDEPEIGKAVAEAIAELQKTRSNVIWIQEMLAKEEVINLYSAAALFVCPSIYEPLGIVNLEAMACETAVVASRAGGIPEVVVDGETGYLVDLDQKASIFEDRLAETIVKALANESTLNKFGKAGRLRVMENFDWDQIALQTVDFYHKTISQFS